ncbi:hypothetical protein A6U97_26360 [Agrobacterium tumefaciens]|uniref:radical SAM protein n=1 Tax=Agrobacterium tumefaciens TaxID=358 RepID=UPI00080F7B92|nr:hypothetical protein A6U97_26360 [Agrobacterium tumefaciens]
MKDIPRQFDYLKKILSETHRNSLDRYLQGGGSPPLIVEFDPTTACNFSCPECISRDLLNRTSISTEDIRMLINKIADLGTKGIIFVGGGEPLAHKAMPMPLEWAYERGLSVGLTTNGSLIDRYIDEIATMVSWTRVSMDAGCEETHQKYRPNKLRSAFSTITKSMEKLARIKRGDLGYSFLAIERATGGRVETNIGEIEMAARLAKDIGCDYFEVKPAVDQNHHLQPFSEYNKRVLEEQYSLSKALETNHFRVHFTDGVFHSMRDDTSQKKEYQQCHAAHLRTLITPDGVFPCPYWRGSQSKRLGSVDDQSLSSVWQGSSNEKLDELIDPSRDCSFYCIRDGFNKSIELLKRAEQQGVSLSQHLLRNDSKDVFF